MTKPSLPNLTSFASADKEFVRHYYPAAVAQEMHSTNARRWNIYPFPYDRPKYIINAETQAEAWNATARRIRDAYRIIDGIAPYDLRNLIEEALRPTAKKFRKKSLHWVQGGDEGLSYCYSCAEKVVRRLQKKFPNDEFFVDGGWGSEEDSQEFCHMCGAPLDNSFTNFACEQELRHFAEHSFDPTCPSDCDSFLEMCGTLIGYDPENNTDTKDQQLTYDLHVLTRQIAYQLLHCDKKLAQKINLLVVPEVASV